MWVVVEWVVKTTKTEEEQIHSVQLCFYCKVKSSKKKKKKLTFPLEAFITVLVCKNNTTPS